MITVQTSSITFSFQVTTQFRIVYPQHVFQLCRLFQEVFFSFLLLSIMVLKLVKRESCSFFLQLLVATEFATPDRCLIETGADVDAINNGGDSTPETIVGFWTEQFLI